MNQKLIEALLVKLLEEDEDEQTQPKNASVGLYPDIGQYVLVRSRNEGINCGYVLYADKDGILLSEARRLYYHRPADRNQSWYEGVASSGLSKDSKVSSSVENKGIVEDYSWISMSEQAISSVMEYKTHAQS